MDRLEEDEKRRKRKLAERAAAEEARIAALPKIQTMKIVTLAEVTKQEKS